MFCHNCGSKNDDANLFCQNCGTRLMNSAASVENSASAAPVQPEPVAAPVAESVQPEAVAVPEVTPAQTEIPAPIQNTAPAEPQPVQPMYYASEQNAEPVQQSQPSAPSAGATPYPASAQPMNYQQTNPYQQPAQPYGQQPNYTYNPSTPVQQPLGMGWFKFLIYFSLFAGAALNIFYGVQYVTGLVYGSDASFVYYYFDGLQVIDILYGIVCFVLAGLAIWTRFMLSGYKKIGPMLLYILYCVNLGTSLIYLVAVGVMLGSIGDAFSASTIGSLLGSVTMLVINIIYFTKRKHLFVN